uniref:Secreted protein n=1 Tax=uncultured microorganism TaxID=358574 RepID=F8UHM3_9ZZZZ|nr:secreted protein [uncultured microorganism]
MMKTRLKAQKQLICNLCLIICVFSVSILTISCATIKEAAKGVAGVSTKILEDGRADAITKNFSYDYFTSYTRSLDALNEMGAYIYAQSLKQRMIAVYVSKRDTTPVGIFFKEIGTNNTQVEVSSPSLTAKSLISARLFKALAF